VRHAWLPLCFDFLPDGTLVVVSGPERALLLADVDGAPRRGRLVRGRQVNTLGPNLGQAAVARGPGGGLCRIGAGFEHAGGFGVRDAAVDGGCRPP